MNAPYDAAIIGAGHNGLVTAAYLARAGWRVMVLEASDRVGGATKTVEFAPGFKVNPGAHWAGALDPSVLVDLQLHDAVTIIPADPAVFAPTPDGKSLVFRSDLDATLESIRSFSSKDAERWSRFNALLDRASGLLNVLYASPPPEFPAVHLRDLPTLGRAARYLKKLGRREMMEVLRVLPMPVAALLDEWFETDVLKGTVGASGIVGVMQGPMAAGTTAVLLHHELGGAMGSVRGGLGELTWALAAMVRERGGEVRTEAAVGEIAVRQGIAEGVVLEDGDEVRAKCVISGIDPKKTFLDLVPAASLGSTFLSRVENIRFRGACARVHLALDGLPTFTAAEGDQHVLRGAISISPSIEYLERAYDDAKYGAISTRPYLEAVIPSLVDDAFAPAGKHVMSVYAQYAPYHLGGVGWNAAASQRLGDTVVDTLTEYAPDLPSKVLHREVLTPVDLEQRFGVTEGSINHGELMLDQFFFSRPVAGHADYRTPIHGLYLCGAGTHGGGGVNAIPGRNAARVVLRDRAKGWGSRLRRQG